MHSHRVSFRLARRPGDNKTFQTGLDDLVWLGSLILPLSELLAEAVTSPNREFSKDTLRPWCPSAHSMIQARLD